MKKVERRAATADFNRGVVASTGKIPKGTQFLRDAYQFDIIDQRQIITESINGGAPALMIHGLLQEGDVPNRNRRRYPTSVLQEAVEALMPDLKQRAVLGEFDHAKKPKIHLDRVSHLITHLEWKQRKLYGQAEVIDGMPFAAMLAALLRAKVRVGISCRGVGEAQRGNDGLDVVLPGFRYVTWDIVAQPSYTNAVMTMLESIQAAASEPTRVDYPKQDEKILRAFRSTFGNLPIRA